MVEIRVLSDNAGAEVHGVDPTRPIAPDDFRRIHDAFLQHLVVVFPGTPLSPQQFCALGRQFGTLQPHIAKRYRHPEVPEIVMMTNRDGQGRFDEAGAARGVGWHSDTPYETVPAKATLLHAVTIPDRGGNTLFANMYRAWETMPGALRRQIDDRQAIFCYGGRAKVNLAALDEDDQAPTFVVHPAVRVHPETGRRSVYVNPYHTVALAGLSRAESDAVLDAVFDWCGRDAFQWQHKWHVGDTIVWENRSAWHSGQLDYPRDQERTFMRTTVRGTPTVEPDAAAAVLAAWRASQRQAAPA